MPVTNPYKQQLRLRVSLVAGLVLLVLLGLALQVTPDTRAAGTIIYVKKDAAGANNGTSWGDAYNHLQDALAAASDGDEIWVAKGVYYPDEGAGRTPGDIQSTFTLVGPSIGLSLYGGFNGTETSRDQADPAKNITVLSGDLDQNDVRDANGITTSYNGIVGSNAIGVVTCNNQAGRFTLDGLVLTGGSETEGGSQLRGGGATFFRCALDLQSSTVVGNQRIGDLGDGGGMFVKYGDYVGPEPAIRVLGSTFRNNYATLSGGGLSADNIGESRYAVSLLVQDTVFEGNYAGTPFADECLQNWGGGGMVVSNTPLLVERSIFRQNSTRCRGGGAMLSNSGKKTVRDSVFIGNQVLDSGASSEFDVGYGGALYIVRGLTVIDNTLVAGNSAYRDGGGISALAKSVFTNVTVVDNTAGRDGGGIWNLPSGPPGSAATLTLSNAIMYGNSAVRNGNGIYNGGWPDPGDFARISHSLVQDSGGSGTGWDSNAGVDLGGNIDTIPGFQNVVPDDPEASNYRLQLSSPAINAGNNAAVTLPTDLDGKPRIFNSVVDMGAYEAQLVCPSVAATRLYVDAHAAGAGTGTSWTDATPSLQNALTLARSCPGNSISEIWVAQGTYYPDDGDYQIDGDREAAFELHNGLAIYGGFQGNETNLSQRNPWHYITTLSGDIGQDDDTDAHDLVEKPADIVGANSYHVVLASNTDSTAVLDGFALTGGQANGSPAAKQHEGGGFFAEAGSPTLNNLTLVGNIAEEGGAMTLVGGSNPAITNAWFGSNAASDFGGALHNESSKPNLTNVLFSGNRAAAGGGAIYNLASSPKMINVTIAGNAAGGTVNLTASGITTQLAPIGGGMINLTGSKPDMYNTIIWNNRDSTGTGTASANIRNVDIGSTPAAENCDIQGLASISGMLYNPADTFDANPLFVVPLDPASSPSFGGDHKLLAGSPAIDAGNDSYNSQTVDLGQKARVQGAAIDMGAYETAPAAHLAVHKSASAATAKVGEVITYTYQVVNTGPVAVTGITATDDRLGAISLVSTTLEISQSTSGVLTYTVVEGDLPGPLVNTATATGTSSVSGTVVASDTATVSLSERLGLALTIGPNTTSAVAGETITNTYTVVNNSDVTLTGVTVTDTKLGAVTLTKTTLAPGESASGTKSYTIQASDEAAGVVSFVANGSGTSPTSKTATKQASALVTVSSPLTGTAVYLPVILRQAN